MTSGESPGQAAATARAAWCNETDTEADVR